MCFLVHSRNSPRSRSSPYANVPLEFGESIGDRDTPRNDENRRVGTCANERGAGVITKNLFKRSDFNFERYYKNRELKHRSKVLLWGFELLI